MRVKTSPAPTHGRGNNSRPNNKVSLYQINLRLQYSKKVSIAFVMTWLFNECRKLLS